jgi:hypothetical protein
VKSGRTQPEDPSARCRALSAWSGLALASSAVLTIGSAPAAAAFSLEEEPGCTATSPAEIFPPLHLPPNSDGPTNLQIGFNVLGITDVDVVRGQFRARISVDFLWCDPRLADSVEASGTDVLRLTGSSVTEKLESIWNPNLSINNLIGSIDIGKREMTIRSDGLIEVHGILEGTLAANLDLHRFPFDSQQLPIEIEPFGWSRESVVLRIDREAIGIDQIFELAEWKVGEIGADVVNVSRTGSDREFSRLQVIVPIERKSGFYIWKAVLPLILIVALSWSVFWISEPVAGRIRICATVMLTIVAYQFATAADLPKLPYMTLFTAFTTASFVMVGVAVVVNVAAFHRADAGGDPEAVLRSDRLARWMLPLGYFATIALIAFVYLG